MDKGPAAAVVVAEKTALVAEKAKEAAKEANVTLTKVFSKVQQVGRRKGLLPNVCPECPSRRLR